MYLKAHEIPSLSFPHTLSSSLYSDENIIEEEDEHIHTCGSKSK
jgi:hypothetical protein